MSISPRQKTLQIASLALALSWVYQGLVPKILFPHTGEMEMLKSLEVFEGYETPVLIFIGVSEMLFGLIVLFVRSRILYILNIVGLVLLAGGALASKPAIYTFPFNPFTLSVSMIGLSIVCMINLERVGGGR